MNQSQLLPVTTEAGTIYGFNVFQKTTSENSSVVVINAININIMNPFSSSVLHSQVSFVASA